MILLLLLLLIVGELMAESNQPTIQSIDIKQKPVMCELRDIEDFQTKNLPLLKPEDIPCECEVLVYSSFSLSVDSKITTNTAFIKSLTCLRPVIITVNRENRYDDWAIVLKEDGNPKDAKVLIEFAKCHNIAGYRLRDFNPEKFLVKAFNPDIVKNAVPYLKQLKFMDDFVIGLVIGADSPTINNPCLTDFESWNGILDFYVVMTRALNECYPHISNDQSPIKMVEHGNSYMMSVEESTQFLKASKCDLEKLYYTVDIGPTDSERDNEFFSNSEVCALSGNLSLWCISNTKYYFDMGGYIKLQRAGMSFTYINLDDVNDSCGCKPFISVRNSYAGFHAKDPIPCKKLDVK